MNAAFFNAVRHSLFGGELTQEQVDGMNDLAKAWQQYGDGDPRNFACILGEVKHESAHTMSPVRETLADTDEQAITRLERAWDAGRLPWVKTPYWRRDKEGFSWFGRGRVQNTHRANYEKLERRFGIAFTKNPSLLLDSKIDAMVTVVGHMEGIWTGKKLGDYIKPGNSVELIKDFIAARAIVNGDRDKKMPGENITYGAKIAGYCWKFLQALNEAGDTAPIDPPPPPDVPPVEPPEPDDAPPNWQALVMFGVVALGIAIAGVIWSVLH